MQEELFQLFVRHFSGETSEKENEQIKHILDTDKEAYINYKMMSDTWTNSLKLKHHFDPKTGLLRLKEKIREKEKEKNKLLLWRVAAIFIAFFVLSSVLYVDFNQTTTIIASKAVEKIFLPDSSVVFLKKNASLSYRSSYLFDFNRKVVLHGEAFFNIRKKNNHEKFTVSTNSLKIQVLGTQFNVQSTNHKSQIVLKEGKVRLFNFKKEQAEIIMSPGDYVSYNDVENSITKNIVNPYLYTIWKEDKINFQNFNLKEVSSIIKQIFGKEVKIKNKTLINKRLNGSAPIDDLNILLKALSEILGEDLIIQNDTIIIR